MRYILVGELLQPHLFQQTVNLRRSQLFTMLARPVAKLLLPGHFSQREPRLENFFASFRQKLELSLTRTVE
jgi:hypothetical protein